MIDSTSTKLSGEMKAWIAENMPPATPPKLAPMAKASSFRLRGVDAHRARRDLVLADRLPGAADARVLQPQVDDDDREHQREQQVVVLDRAAEIEAEEGLRLAKLKPPRRNGSMRAMPCGPLVMLTGRDRLLRKMRMISPKPSVTMAR